MRDGAACLGDMDLFESHGLFHCLSHQVDVVLRDAGVGDEKKIRIDVRIFFQLVFYIFHKYFIQRAAVFLPDSHTSVVVVHLDAWLEFQHIGSESSYSRTAPACAQKCERIKDETAVAPAGSFTELFRNGCGDLSGVRSAGARFRNDFFCFLE